jgi:hypothetical protein
VSDDVIEVTPDPAIPEVDPLAEAKAEVEAEKARLADREKALTKGFNEIAEREKAVSARAIPDDPSDVDPDLEKQLNPYIERAVQSKYGGAIEAAQSAFLVSVDSEMERFAEKSGVDKQALNDVITSYGLRPKDATMASIRDVFAKAAAIHTSTTFDPEAERQRLREEILKEAADGTTVDAVRPIRTEVAGAEPDLESMSASERYAYLVNKGVRPE